VLRSGFVSPAARPPGGPSSERASRPLRGLAVSGFALLAGFHVWILGARLREDAFTDPAVALRWAGAAALLALAWLFRRRGLTVASGRSGLVFWALVLLLHVGAAPATTPALPGDDLLAALPLALALPAALAAAAVGPRGRVRRKAVARARPRPAHHRPAPGRPLSGLALRFVPRPPPAA
jgi:peptidoglycan/LPS O-acetylase OafA/YrhL